MPNENRIFKNLVKSFHDNKLGHAFLLETNNQEQTLKELLQFLKEINCEEEYHSDCHKCNLCNLISKQEITSLKIIRPEGQTIKKEQILELKNNFLSRPVFSKYNMYIILNAECLNSSSANVMLKFLEEPEENIIGFFITNNKENIIDTIKSRCQIYVNNYKIEEKSLNDLENISLEYVKELEVGGLETILYNKDKILPQISEREDLIKFLKEILNIYNKLFLIKIGEYKVDNFENLQFLLKIDIKYFINKLNLVKNLLIEAQYNVNSQLILDRLVLESR